MFDWAITFLVVALASAALGFGRLAGSAISAAQIIVPLALVACAIATAIGLMRLRAGGRHATLRMDFRSKNNA